jgi:predicted lipoprotein
MNSDNEKRRRAVAAQGFAALAFFFFAHGAHAATPPAHAFVHPAAPGHTPTLTQRRP